MKVSNAFKQTIQAHLEQRAQTDPLFAPKFANPEKNIDNCCTYILNTVKASGENGLEDDEVFGMAVHYYDEESIEIGKPISGKVVVNHTVELTEEDKAEAKAAAIKKIQDEAYQSMTAKKPVRKDKPVVSQNSLFGDESENEATD